MTEVVFRKRLVVLLCAFGVWVLLASGRLFYYTVPARDELLAESRRLAWREGVIPVLRGRLLSADGIPLAWCAMSLELTLEVWPESEKGKARLIRFLHDAYNVNLTGEEKTPRVLLRGVSIERMETERAAVSGYPALEWKIHVERKRVEYPEVRALLGECRRDASGQLNGVSGAEKDFNTELRGVPGMFHVMLDRKGEWLSDTLRIDADPVPGKDVLLKETLAELRAGKGAPYVE